MIENKQILTAEDVAEMLSVSKQSIYRLARQNLIPHVRLGNRTVRFSKIKIEEWLSKEFSSCEERNYLDEKQTF